MKSRLLALSLAACVAALIPACSSEPPPPATKETAEFSGEWTADHYPSYVRRITHFGQRADWSHDGKRIIFLEKTYGDVYEIDLETEIIRAVTHHYYHNGYTRALYLSNGDILLSGSRTFDPEHHSDARGKTAELWVLSKDLDKPPVPLGEFCSEGPTPSRKHLKIAWAVDHDNYPQKLPEGVSQMWMAEIDYASGEPKLANKKLVLDSRKLDFKCNLESQNFVPPDEEWLTFSAYGYQNTEAMGLNLETGEVVNYSNAPGQYDEPEGVFPDGKYTLVESDKHGLMGSKHDDLYKLALDGSGSLERLGYFNDGKKYKSTNGVVSDDGRYLAFQVPETALIAGVGQGIYIMDLKAAGF